MIAGLGLHWGRHVFEDETSGIYVTDIEEDSSADRLVIIKLS
jgi:hypothetical protein